MRAERIRLEELAADSAGRTAVEQAAIRRLVQITARIVAVLSPVPPGHSNRHAPTAGLNRAQRRRTEAGSP